MMAPQLLTPFLALLPLLPQIAPGEALRDRGRAHYARVVEELLAERTDHLTDHQRAARAEIIGALRAYGVAAEFPTHDGRAGQRVPVYVDEAGRHCSVAMLLDTFGGQEFLDRVVSERNHAWIAELADEPDFRSWCDAVGLTTDEAARIHYPGGFVPPPPPGGGTYGCGLGPLPPNPGAGPASDTPTNTDPGSPGPGPGSPGAGPGAPGPPAVGGAGTPGGALMMQTTPGWWTWWELNQLAWLAPRPLEAPTPDAATTGALGSPHRGGSWLDTARGKARRVLKEELDHPDAGVRARAVLAFARAAGAEAVPAAKELLDDPQRHVRLAALLALGESRSEEGVHALLTMLLDEDAALVGEEVFAVVALGYARANGQAQGVEGILASLMAELEHDHGDAMTVAYLLHHALAPSEEIAAHVRCRTRRFPVTCSPGPYPRGPNEPGEEARVLAVGALAADAGDDVLPRLLDALGARSVQERRAATFALSNRDGALEPMMSAYEAEHDPFARGFTALAIGEHGGPRARTFLDAMIEDGAQESRPWSYLALGILAGRDDDAEARALLRRHVARESSRERRAAGLLALGLARDGEAHVLLVDHLGAREERTRTAAATALGLVGEERGREALLARVELERSSPVRVALAQALAAFGDGRDAELLLELLRSEPDRGAQTSLGATLGFHGTREALLGVLAELEGDDLTPQARAGAVDALGLLLAPPTPRGRLTGSSNFLVFPPWVGELVQYTL